MQKVAFSDALKVWIKVALYSFGGPAGQIAVMHKLIVEEKKWISESRFLHALNYCMLLPGPEAQQLITYIGWLLHKTKGGIIAGTLFILPGFISILILSILYAFYNDLAIVNAIFFGIKPAVVAIVFGAVVKLSKRALITNIHILIAIHSFIAIFFFKIPFPLIILFAGISAYLLNRFYPAYISSSSKKNDLYGDDHFELHAGKRSLLYSIKTTFIFLIIWFIPLLISLLILEPDHTLVKEMFFFSKVAVVTFGGAYSVLAYVAQQAVENFHWLQPGEMLDGLGMAETTPGPLIQVVQFVGFMGAFREPGVMDPLTAAVTASFLVTWVTFVPCFLFVFAGAPHMENLRANKSINATLSGVTAAVTGVIVNLGLWFTVYTLFTTVTEKNIGIIKILSPDPLTFNGSAAIVMVISFICYFLFKLNLFYTLLVSILSGVIIYFIF